MFVSVVLILPYGYMLWRKELPMGLTLYLETASACRWTLNTMYRKAPASGFNAFSPGIQRAGQLELGGEAPRRSQSHPAETPQVSVSANGP